MPHTRLTLGLNAQSPQSPRTNASGLQPSLAAYLKRMEATHREVMANNKLTQQLLSANMYPCAATRGT